MKMYQKKIRHFIRKISFQYVAGICLISLFFGIAPVFSQTPEVQESLSETSLDFLRQNLIIKKLRDQLNFNSNYYETLAENLENTKSDLKDTQKEIKTLQDQIQEIDLQIRLSESRILTTRRNIRETEVLIEKLYETIDLKEIELEENKRQLASYLKLMYIHEKRFGDRSVNGLNIVKLLFADSSLSETLQRETYLKIFQNSEEDILERLDHIKRELNIEQENLSYELGRLQDMKEVLEGEKQNLEAQKAGKERLLSETEGKEEVFQKMLAENLQQEEEVLDEINALRDNIEYFNLRLSRLKNQLTPQQYEEIIDIKESTLRSATQYKDGDILKFSMWPVNPKRGISAYFTDAGYKKRFGADHRAVDLPVPQGTAVLAPDSGLVVKVRDMDEGYNYVVIAHKQGVMTLYGHLNEIIVDVGDYLEMGDVIGFSGGVLGTRGAGLRTTGAHLHFEVFQDGVRVDPLDYLPLEILPKEYVPTRFLEELDIKLGDFVEDLFGKDGA